MVTTSCKKTKQKQNKPTAPDTVLNNKHILFATFQSNVQKTSDILTDTVYAS